MTDFSPTVHAFSTPQMTSAQEPPKGSSLWPEPAPIQSIRQPLSPVLSMTPEMLPEAYREWLLDIAERMQCPLDYVAVGAILVTAALISAGCGIRPNAEDSWTVIPNLWGGIVGTPGSFKSSALREVTAPLKELNAEARETYDKNHKTYLQELEIHTVTKESIKKALSKAVADGDEIGVSRITQKLNALEAPNPPSCRRYSINEATVEKLHEVLSHNERGILIFRDELDGLLKKWEKQGHEGERAFYLEAWNGDGEMTVDRIQRGTVYARRLCVSILGGIQPATLFSYFERTLAHMQNDGLLQRFQLFIYPDESETWRQVKKSPNHLAAQKASVLMKTLATLDFCQWGAVCEEEMPVFRLTPDAQEIFDDWFLRLGERLCSHVDAALLRGSISKQRKLVPSLALIFHLLELISNNTAGPITKEAVEKAITWCHYLESHTHRIYDMSSTPMYEAARHLAHKILKGELPNIFELRTLYRKGWTLIKTKEAAEAACMVLVEKGWLMEKVGPDNLLRYAINPHVKGESCRAS